MSKLNYEIILQLKDKLSATVSKIKQQFDSVTDSVNKTSSSASKFSSVCAKIDLITFNNVIQMADSYGKLFSSLTDSGVTFEQSMADLSAITGIVGDDLEVLGKQARKVGKESGLGAAGAAEAYKLLASNIDVAKIGITGLNELQAKTVTLSQASGMSMADSANSLAGTINQFGLQADQANRVINVLAAGSKYGAAEIPELAQSFKVVGSAASAMGLNVEQTAGALEVMSKANLKGSEAGTALRNIILKLNTELGVNLGETSLSQALEGLKPKLTDATYLSKLFGMENVAAAQYLIGNASAVEEMTQKVTATNVAQEQAAIRTDTTAEKMKRYRASIDDIKISLTENIGANAAWMTVLAENMVMIGQMAPGVYYLSKGIIAVATAENFKKVATIASTAATQAATIAQAALNAVMSANPIAIVVLAIAALVAGLIAAYNNSETFRNIVDKCWAAVKEFAVMIWDNLVKAFNAAKDALTKFWNMLKSFFGLEAEAAEVTTEHANATDQLATSTDNATGAVVELGNATEKTTAALNRNMDTLGGMEQAISDLQKKQKEASIDEARNIQKVIEMYQRKYDAMQLAVVKSDEKAPDAITGGAFGIGSVDAIVPEVNTDELRVAADNVRLLDKTFGTLGQTMGDIKGAWGDAATQLQEMNSPLETLQWGFVSIAQSMQSSLMDGAESLQEFGAAFANTTREVIGALLAEGVAHLVKNALQTASLMGPFGFLAGAGLAAAAGGLAKAAFNTIVPKFADGGIVSGPTLGLMGEYPGASNNPEVIAPLSKLKKLIEPQGGFGGEVEFRIEGNALVGVLNKMNRLNTRTR